ncbi:hypothetical protein A2U01_0078683 [Trifolium medium]|uniref:Uncharacterized protein n=1 Tax=Trifolium medium TaxID=97028 RepID=A0A392T9C9_9FABA|nr:hypothetical protein [Trifolium medium]
MLQSLDLRGRTFRVCLLLPEYVSLRLVGKTLQRRFSMLASLGYSFA